jgi:putative ABC transport system permease protein
MASPSGTISQRSKMFRNYLTAALRHLARNKLYVGISVGGLSIGFAAAILIGLFVRDELTHEHFLPGYDRLFLLSETVYISGQAPIVTPTSQPELAAPLSLNFPEVRAVVRLMPTDTSLRHGNVEAPEKVYWADPSFFSVLPLPVIAGNPATALTTPDGIVLTRSLARKYFHEDDPIGGVIEIDRKHPMRVTAVIEDLPANTHLDLQVIASGLASFSDLAAFEAEPARFGDSDSAYTYVRVDPAASIDALVRRIPDFGRRQLRRLSTVGVGLDLRLIPLPEVHLTPFTQRLMRPVGDRATVYALSIVGVLVLVVASINFVNLMTARAGRRAVEVGIRKCNGATRRNLIVQFMGESMLYSALGMLGALALAELTLPALNAFLTRSMTLHYSSDGTLAATLLGVTVLLGALAGAYPALVLSSFSPSIVLKSSTVPASGTGWVRQALVMLQFAILIGLIVSTTVVYRQVEFARNEGLRLDTDQVLLVASTCAEALRDEVAALHGVRSVACSQGHALNFVEGNYLFLLQDGTQVFLTSASVGFGFLELYGQRPLAGRFFSERHPGDALPPDFFPQPSRPPNLSLRQTPEGHVVLNESAARKAGFATPAAAVGQLIFGYGNRPLEIIGVVPDFALDAIHKLISPAVYGVYPPSFEYLSVKLNGREIPETLASIDRLWTRLGDPTPIRRFFLDERVQTLYLDVTRRARLFAIMAVVTVFIACLGLFGLAAFTAARRTKEIGIRKALGAGRGDIVRLLMWQFARPVLVASLFAWPMAGYAMLRWLQGFAYHVNLEPAIFLGASTLALAIALLTVTVHTVQMVRAKPVRSLRYE